MLKDVNIKFQHTSKSSGPNASCASNAGLDDDTSDCCMTVSESIRGRFVFNGEQSDLFTVGDDVNPISSIYSNILINTEEGK